MSWTQSFFETLSTKKTGVGNLAQNLWGMERADYGLPKHVEKALITRRSLILWGCMFLMGFALAPGLFPQVRDFIVLADTGVKEEAVRLISFLVGSIGLTWLIDRGWRSLD